MAEPLSLEAEFTLLKSQFFQGIKRRVAKRYRCALATIGKLTFPGEGVTLDTWAHNLSESGIGLSLDRSLDVGTLVQLVLKGEGKELKIAATVAHATQEVDGWRIGCAFERPLDADELESLL